MNTIELNYGSPTTIDGDIYYLLSIEKKADVSAEVDSVLTLRFVKTWDGHPPDFASFFASHT